MIGKPRKFIDPRNGNIRWRVDWRDETGKRHQEFFPTERAALDRQDEINRRPVAPAAPAPAPGVPLGDPAQTLRATGARWLDANAHAWRPRYLASNRYLLDTHVYPFVIDGTPLGDFSIAAVQRAHVKALLTAKRHAGFAPDTVRLIFRALSGLLGEAVEDEVIPYNPAGSIRLGKGLRRQMAKPTEDEQVKAMTEDELTRFLNAAKDCSTLYPIYFAGAQTGMRIGELCGWQLPDLNLAEREATVCRSLGQECSMRDPKPGPTKTGHARTIELSRQLVGVLDELSKGRKALALRQGWHPVPSWVFVTGNGTPYSERNVLRDFHRVLVRAGFMPKDRAPGVPAPFSPHSLRHTFATLHLLKGDKPQWVQQQLGHSSIKVTVDVYGSWIRLRDPEAADRLDALVRAA